MAQIDIQNDRGIALKFNNGYTLSIKWGVGNYCANRDAQWRHPDDKNYKLPPSTTVEWAVFGPKSHNLLPLGNGVNVFGWFSVNEIGELIDVVQNHPENLVEWSKRKYDETK